MGSKIRAPIIINTAIMFKTLISLVNPIKIKSAQRDPKDIKKAKPLKTLLLSVICKMNQSKKKAKNIIPSKKYMLLFIVHLRLMK